MYAPYTSGGGGGRGLSNAPPGSPIGSPGRAGRPSGGPQRGHVGPFEPGDPDKTRHYELPKGAQNALLPFVAAGLAARLSGAIFDARFRPEGYGKPVTIVPTSTLDGAYVEDASPCCLPLGGCPPAQTSSSWMNWNSIYVGGGACQTTGVPQSDRDWLEAHVWPNSGANPGDRIFVIGNWTATAPYRLRVHKYATVIGASTQVYARYETLGLPYRHPIIRALDPMLEPIGYPTPQPVPLPPSLAPYQPPAPEGSGRASPDTGGQPGGPGRPRPYVPEPPGKGKKEKKWLAPTAGGLALARVLEAITESIDALEAVWAALPGNANRKAPPPQKMLLDLFNGWDKLDWEQAAINLARESAEDKAWGKLHSVGRGRSPIDAAKRGIGIILRNYT